MTNEISCILVIDDNPIDLDLIQRAIKSSCSHAKIILKDNGSDSLSYLMGEGEYGNRNVYPYPSLVITDLNMPMVDGFAILEHFRANPTWVVVPTIVFSSSQDPDDIQTAYMLGASAYHLKPQSYSVFEKTIKSIIEYWEIVEKPISSKSGQHEKTISEGKHGERFIKPDRMSQVRNN